MRGSAALGAALGLLALLCAPGSCQEVNRAMVAQISTFPYEDALNKGGLSFETKDGTDLLRRRVLIASNGDVGFNLPEGSVPEASIHAAGDILAKRARFVDGVDALSVSATTNVSAHTLSSSLGVISQVSATSIAASTVDVSERVLARDVEAAQVRASGTVTAHEVSATEDVRTKNLYATDLVNATEVVTTSIKSAGIPFDEAWESHPNEICQDQATSAENAVAGASTADMCIAACMGVSRCAGVTFYQDPSLREGVDANCYMAYGACVNISDTIAPYATVYHRPMVRVLDMADELLAAKAEIARLRAEMSTLRAEMTSFTASVNAGLSALSAVASSGSYNDLGNKPAISDLGGTLAYSSLSGTPSLSVVSDGSCEACRDHWTTQPGAGDWAETQCPGGGAGQTAQVYCGTASNRICLISQTKYSEAEHQYEWHGCHIYISGGNWYVKAVIGDKHNYDIDTFTYCQASCFLIGLS